MDGDGTNDDDADDDIDGDSLDDDDNSEMDIDGDGRGDDADDDIDGDNRNNGDTAETDTDGDGRMDDDADEEDDDGDGVADRDDDDDDNDGAQDNDDGDHHDEADEQEVQVTLTREAAAPAGSRSRVKIQKMATGKVELEVDARDIPAGAYDVTVDGILIGQLSVAAGGEGEQEWETNANKPSEINLTIEVIGKPITVSKEGVVYFSGTVPTPPPPGDPGGGDPDDGTGGATVSLTRTPAAPADAKAKVEIEFGTAGVKSLEVETEDLAVGAYDFLVGGTVRGTFTVSGDSGHLRFKAEPNDPGEILLDFAAAGEAVSIRQGETTYFNGSLPAVP